LRRHAAIGGTLSNIDDVPPTLVVTGNAGDALTFVRIKVETKPADRARPAWIADSI